MLSGKNIICFSKDWSEDPTSNNHVMSLLAKDNRILWINSIVTRTPKFSSGRDLRRMLNKVGKFLEGPKEVQPNLWVYTPIVFPFPHNSVAVKTNEQILKVLISLLKVKLKMNKFQLWTFIPNSVDYIGRMGESLVVYYCTDDFSQFKHLDGKKILQKEEKLCRIADVVFTTSQSLLQMKKVLNTETHLASHGVDYEHFSKALDQRTSVSPELADLPKPIVGFFGLIHTWIDQDLICFVAKRHPDWSIVLIGKADVDTSQLEAVSNIHLLGRRPYKDLPVFCKGFSVGIIPFVVNELTHHVNPIKLREYLSAGLSVVSTSLPEVRYYSDICTVVSNENDFLAGLEKAVKDDSPEARQRRSALMKKETWHVKVGELGDIVRRIEDVHDGK